jgi:hypothetical protein
MPGRTAGDGLDVRLREELPMQRTPMVRGLAGGSEILQAGFG